MTSVLSLLVLILSDGTEDRTMMTSHRCRLDILAIREVLHRHPHATPRTAAGVPILEFQCRPYRLEAMG